MIRRLRSAPLALALIAVAVTVLALIAVLSISGTHGSSAGASLRSSSGPESGFDGAALPGGTIAPDFTLSNQGGQRVSLSEYRGEVVILAFLYSTCGATCILIAQQIRGALDELPHPVPVLIVSADPAADSATHIARFLSEVSLTGRVQYLTGPLSRLRPIWAAYRIKPASAGARAFENYASVLLIDASGFERVLFEPEQLTPESLSHDIRKLDGDSTHP